MSVRVHPVRSARRRIARRADVGRSRASIAATPLIGPFCAACGQRAVPPTSDAPRAGRRRVRRILRLGRQASPTHAALALMRPGQLTRRVSRGTARAATSRRCGSTSRASLVYFAAVRGRAEPRRRDIDVGSPTRSTDRKRPSRHGVSIGDRSLDADELIAEDRETDPGEGGTVRAASAQRLRRISRRSGRDSGTTSSTRCPKALFVLLPVFAGILALFYREARIRRSISTSRSICTTFLFVALEPGEAGRSSRT